MNRITGFLILAAMLSGCSQSPSFSEILDGPYGSELSLSPQESQLISTESLSFSISGGVPPYELILESPLEGEGEDLSDSIYTAPSDKTGLVEIRVQDSYESSVMARITVVPATGIQPLTISPSSISIYKGRSVTLEAGGGIGAYSYSLEQGIGGTGEALEENSYRAPSDLGGTAVVSVSDELNNTAEARIYVIYNTPDAPDVNYNSLSLVHDSGYSGGGLFTGSFTFRNSGTDDGSAPVSWIVYYSEDDIVGEGDTIVSFGTVPAVEADKPSSPIPFSGTWPYPATNKTYNIIATISSWEDQNHDDNTGLIPVDVEAVVMDDIDYTIESLNSSPPHTVGQRIDLGFNIVNRGYVDGTDPVVWEVFRSIDDVWDEEDSLVASGVEPALPNGTFRWVSVNDTWPAPGGEYYLIIKVHTENEINKTNNINVFGPLNVG